VSTAKGVQKGTKTVSDLENSVNQASSSTSKFSATLKTVAANMAIMFTVDLAIKAIAKAWDTLNVTVEEQEEKIKITE